MNDEVKLDYRRDVWRFYEGFQFS